MTVLLREAIGDRLRHARTIQHRSLREISHTARVSLGYLSEVERGQKEASSELLSAICEALEFPLPDLLHAVASDVAVLDSMAMDGADIEGTHWDQQRESSAGQSREPSGSSGSPAGSLKATISGPRVARMLTV